ncbi:MAG: hypothetical protein RIB98_05415 [Acidimicrobiales bacterium]
MTPRRLAITLFGLSLVLGACGDDGEPSAGDSVDPPIDAAADVDEEQGDSTPSDAPSADVGAVVTIGDEQYVLPEESTCISNPRAMTSLFTDGPDIRVEIDLPPPDWETDTASEWGPPEVVLTDRSGEGRRSYQATGNVGERYPDTDAPLAGIEEYEMGDGWATGSGNVIDGQALVDAEGDGAEPPPLLPMTFEVVCEP